MEEDGKLYENVQFLNLDPGIQIDLNKKKNFFERILPIYEKESERVPMKIQFDIDSAISGSDPLQCKKVGQIVNWYMAKNYTCTKNDIITEEKLNALNGTLNNVASYINKLIKVKHSDIQVITVETDQYKYTPKVSKSNADHYVSIFVRPFTIKTIGGSRIIATQPKTNRIIQSEIILNPLYLPTSAESESTKITLYFKCLLHEMIHSFGLNEHLMKLWYDKSTGFPYKHKMVENFQRDGYDQIFPQICTPKSMEVAQRRARRTHYKDGKRFCLELENTDLKVYHPKATIYNKDVMARVASEYSSISEITLALLDDIGWYTVNWSMAMPMTWGAPELLTKEELDLFYEKPTHRNFPDRYKNMEPVIVSIGHDYKSYGTFNPIELNESTDSYDLLADYYLFLEDGSYKPDLYVTNETKYFYPLPPYDYVALKNLANVCSNDEWAILQVEPTISGKCIKGSVISNSSFVLKYNSEELNCEKEGQNVTARTGEKFECPDPNYIAKIDAFLSAPPYDYGHVTLIGDASFGRKLRAYSKLIGIIVGFIAILVIIVFVSAMIFCRKCCCIHFCCCFSKCCHCASTDETITNEISTPFV
jgi:hypothetical protein